MHPQIARMQTVADLLEWLGDVPPERVPMEPVPGTATVEDLIRRNAETDHLYELVDGVLVEKAMGAQEGSLAAWLIVFIGNYLMQNRIGQVFTPDTMFRTQADRIRMPDVCFVRSDRFPTGGVERVPVLEHGMDLAVEVLSVSNRPGEIRRKVEEYFARGVSLVWLADPGTRTVRVHTTPDESTELTEDDSLSGGEVLPGFELSIRQWFEFGTSA